MRSLLAASALGVVEVWTIPSDMEEAEQRPYLLSMRSGRTRLQPASPPSELGIGSDLRVRTRIVVRDLFYNLPVRRKVAPATGGDRVSQRTYWQQIKTRLAMACVPLPIQVELYEGTSGHSVFFSAKALPQFRSVANGIEGRYLALLRVLNSGLVQPMWWGDVIHVQGGNPRIDALISFAITPSARVPSLVYINGQLLPDHARLSQWLAEHQYPGSSGAQAAPEQLTPLRSSPLPPHLLRSMHTSLASFLAMVTTAAIYPHFSQVGTTIQPLMVLSITLDSIPAPAHSHARAQARTVQHAIGATLYTLLCTHIQGTPHTPRQTPAHPAHPVTAHRSLHFRTRNATLEHGARPSKKARLTPLLLPPIPPVPPGALAWRDPVTHQVHLIDARTGNRLMDPPPPTEQQREPALTQGRDALPTSASNSITLRKRLGTSATDWTRTSGSADPASAPAWLLNEARTSRPRSSFLTTPIHPAQALAVPGGHLQSDIWDLTQPSQRLGVPGTNDPTHFPHPTLHNASTSSPLGTAVSSTELAISHTALSRARVIGQFERKCIIASLPLGTQQAELLVAIDQHAADERVRVERMWYSYLSACRSGATVLDSGAIVSSSSAKAGESLIRTRQNLWSSTQLQHESSPATAHEPLDPPLDVTPQLAPATLVRIRDLCGSTTPSSDPELSMVFRGMLTFWGFDLMLGVEHEKVQLRTAPKIVAERLVRDSTSCRTTSDHLASTILQSILRTAHATVGPGGTGHPEEELRSSWKWMQADLSSPRPPRPPSRPRRAEEDLSGVLRFVPRPLRRMVESRACRGAIMFNDALDRDQATRLVNDLSHCQFPFQCAHGRPSLVPLVRLHFGPSTRRGTGAQESSLVGETVAEQAGVTGQSMLDHVDWDWNAFAAAEA